MGLSTSLAAAIATDPLVQKSVATPSLKLSICVFFVIIRAHPVQLRGTVARTVPVYYVLPGGKTAHG